uniref:Methyltransferase like 25 n=1 Tax=Latimeria chalumnae TaxID=7897 RepID=H3BAQ3_LATCH
SSMASLLEVSVNIATIKSKLNAVKDFLTLYLKISNAHTVDFYTRDLWNEFVAVSPETVLSAFSCQKEAEVAFGKASKLAGICETYHPKYFLSSGQRLVNVAAFIRAAKAHSLPNLDVCTPLDKLLQELQGSYPQNSGKVTNTDEFMNSKKSHEVQLMSQLLVCLAKRCDINQVIDLGSGKGYLGSFLSMQYGLKVYGIDSSSTNTHGATERNRKLKKYGKAVKKKTDTDVKGDASEKEEERQAQEDGNTKGSICEKLLRGNVSAPQHQLASLDSAAVEQEPALVGSAISSEEEEAQNCATLQTECTLAGHSESESCFLEVLPAEVADLSFTSTQRCQLSREEKERRKMVNMKKRFSDAKESSMYSPITSYITAESELKDIVSNVQDSLIVGLHTCGNLAADTLRIFVCKPELKAVCNVGCCYHLLSEEFDRLRDGN